MKRYILTFAVIAALLASCGGNTTKMPWEDDLNNKNEQTPNDKEEEEKENTDPSVQDEIGKTLNPWSEGYLDIHTISTGRGECLLYILPDGTTLVVDAGEFSRVHSDYANVGQRPNALIRPSTTYAKYIRHFMPKSDTIDYFNISHFHMDHMGNMEPEYTTTSADKGGYVLSGMTALYQYVPFREVIDRAYPNYDTLKVTSASTDALANYKKFCKYHKELKVSRFELGKKNQFAMRFNPAAYPNFSIENVCANSHIWKNGQAVDIYPNKSRAENSTSCGFVIRYGKFDFHAAGDIGDYEDLEYQVATVVGQVEATKSHHHLSPHSNCKKAMNVLKPQVLVATSFYVREIQPDKSKFGYITEGGCNIYCTSVGEPLLIQYPAEYAACRATSGHIVIRVEPNGDRFWVYVLDDTTSDFKVKRIDGPFISK
ncbi:MAG: hypothetical protein IJX65_00970 [Alistipes sp.]|nr:hypothetical protein [Alistipes sp.]